MYKNKKKFFVKVLTPTHVGSGEGLEYVDMPIQRESHSNIPKIEASSLKGSIKSNLIITKDEENIKKYLGDDSEDGASKIGFTDAKLLFFPLKSAKDIFRLVTCPYVINRWLEDFDLKKISFPSISDESCYSFKIDEDKMIIVEEFAYKAQKHKKVEKFKKVFENYLKKLDISLEKVLIISDSNFKNFVTMYTEIITRNKINPETGVTVDGGLFTEEYLPAESVLYFLSFETLRKNSESVKEFWNYLKNMSYIQIGGNATIGKGFCKIYLEGDEKHE